MEQALVILTNLPDLATARALAREIVEGRLAACVNVLPGIHSIYQWQGAVEEAHEVTLLIKSMSGRYDELEAAIARAHPYDLPEIIAFPISAGLPAYLGWIAAQTKRDVDA